MSFEDDFVNEDTVSFEIDGRKFEYKPVTTNDENNWIPEYMKVKTVVDGDTSRQEYYQDLGALNKCKIRNLKKVPWVKEVIEKFTGIKAEWSELNNDQKWEVMGKIKPAVFTKIINKINEIDAGSGTEKKN